MNEPPGIHLEKLEQAVEQALADAERAGELNRLAASLKDEDRLCARAAAEDAEQYAANSGSLAEFARSLHLQGYCTYRLGDRPLAVTLLQRSLACLETTPDCLLEAECRRDLGVVQYLLGDYQQALTESRQALRLYEDCRDEAGQAQTLNNIGNIYSSCDDHAQALSFYRQSLHMRQALNDREGVGCSLNNIGIVFMEMKDHARALDYLEQCLAVSRENRAFSLEVRCLGNLVACYRDLGRYEEALAISRSTLELAKHHGLQSDECYILAGWGDISVKAGQGASAIPLYQEAMALAVSLSDRRSECEICAGLGRAYLSLDALAEARNLLMRSYELAQSLGSRLAASVAMEGLAEVAERESNWPDALVWYKRYHALEREIFNESADRRAKALMVQVEIDRAQQAAELHRLENVELVRINEEKEQLLEELRAQAEELERQATRDSLTGLHNRRFLEEWLARVFAQARRYNTPLTVVLADIDHFKDINDTFGHQIGDAVLREVARLLRSRLRESDLAARYGGEEFVAALPATDASQARVLCERIRRAVKDFPWTQIHPQLAVTLSLGLSDDYGAESHERLLSLADARMYDAKRAGRNRVSTSFAVTSAARTRRRLPRLSDHPADG